MSGTGNLEEGVGLPSTALGLHLLGILHAHEGRYGEAEAAFRKAVEADPEMVGSYVELGLVHVCQGDNRRMLDALRRAVGVGPGAVRAYLGEQPLGDLRAEPHEGEPCGAAGNEAQSPATLSAIALAMSDMAAGRDDEAVGRLELVPVGMERGTPPVVTLLTLAYLLRGDRLVADEDCISRAGAPASAGGQDTQAGAASERRTEGDGG